MNKSGTRYHLLRNELPLRKAALRNASNSNEKTCKPDRARDDSEESMTLVLGKQIAANPVAAAAVTIAVMSALGPWRSVKVASRAITVGSLAKRLNR